MGLEEFNTEDGSLTLDDKEYWSRTEEDTAECRAMVEETLENLLVAECRAKIEEDTDFCQLTASFIGPHLGRKSPLLRVTNNAFTCFPRIVLLNAGSEFGACQTCRFRWSELPY